VFTPESEKRRIKRTLDEDDEINALYGAFGLSLSREDNSGGRVHARQTITEPSLPLKSSSSLLRRLALQDLPSDNPPTLAKSSPSDSHSPSDGWWGGGLAASLGRAAKAVIDVSSPPVPPVPTLAKLPIDLPPVGLARPGPVRKVKSNWELNRGKRSTTVEPDQEQRPPPTARVIRANTESPKRNPVLSSPPPSIQALMNSAPPPVPPTFEDDTFGYSPLPLDYEDQCDDDTALYGDVDPFLVGSLGSSSRYSSVQEADMDTLISLGSRSSIESGDIGLGGEGRRILANAVEYDENFDSPTQPKLVLPEVDMHEPDVPAAPQAIEEASPPGNAEPAPAPRPLKYGDRATKLRMAKSVPTLKHKPSWLESLRFAVYSRAGYEPTPGTDLAHASTVRGPIKISPATPAPPALVTAVPVICDSASAEAVDLPAIPPSITVTRAPQTESYVPLRLRASLSALRSAVGLEEQQAAAEDATPVLSPRLDWKAQGNQFAGWDTGKDKQGMSPASRARKSDSRRDSGARVSSGASIDYSKSFFYKPATPPRHSQDEMGTYHTGADSAIESTGSKDPVLGKRRSVKSLRAALLLPVAPVPPVPAIPAAYRNSSTLSPSTPPSNATHLPLQPPILAISSPGAWEAGLPPRELVLEGEEWDAKDGGAPGDWGRRKSKGKKRGLKKKRSVGF
jgi:hypothetical protein